MEDARVVEGAAVGTGALYAGAALAGALGLPGVQSALNKAGNVVISGAKSLVNSIGNLITHASQTGQSDKPYEATPENVDRMKQGKAPVGKDGKSVECITRVRKPTVN